MAGCGRDAPPIGQVGAIAGFIGGAATDEPNATVVALDVLSAGGNAVDAAVAGFFALTVTYPVGAGLGGGGACVVYDTKTNEAQTAEFLAGRPAAEGPYAIPGAVRGLATMHARYGRLAWSALVAPAEKLARFGHPMSRALASQLQLADAAGLLTAATRAPFQRPDGSLKAEGDKVERLDLAGTLGSIRAQGAGALYGGPLGHALVEAAKAVGSNMGMDDLRAYRPVQRATRSIEFGNEKAHTALPPPLGGSVLYDLLEGLRSRGIREDPARLLAATAKAYGGASVDAAAALSADAALAAGDREGGAVACGFTMGKPFGAGVIAQSVGVPLAPVAGREEALLAPLVLANHNVNQGFMAVAASGGWAAPIAAALVGLALAQDGGELTDAVAAPRAVRLTPEGPVHREEGWRGGGGGALPPAPIGRVQAIWCPAGLVRGQRGCRFASDPRGHGLAGGQVR